MVQPCVGSASKVIPGPKLLYMTSAASRIVPAQMSAPARAPQEIRQVVFFIISFRVLVCRFVFIAFTGGIRARNRYLQKNASGVRRPDGQPEPGEIGREN